MNYPEYPLARRVASAISSLALLTGFSGLGIAIQLNHPTGYLNSSGHNTSTSRQVFIAPGGPQSSPDGSEPQTNEMPFAEGEQELEPPSDLELAPSPPMPAEFAGDPALAALFNKALEAEEKGDLKAAAASYRKLLHSQPDLLPAHINLGINLLRQEQPKQAVYHLNRAVKLAPENPQTRAILAQTYLQLKQPAQAYQQWVKLAEMKQPDHGQAAFNAGALAFEQLKKNQDAERWLKLAHQQSKGDDPRIALMLGEVYAARGKHSQASTILQPLAKEFPQIAEIQTALAEAQWQSGAKSAALATLRVAEKNVPPTENEGQNLAQVRLMLGRALAEQKEYGQATSTLKAALKQLPKKSPSYEPTQALLAQTYAAQAEAAEKSGNAQTALTAWKEASTFFPDDPYAYIQRGRLFEKQGEERQALAEYNRALKLTPRDPALISTSALLEEKTGDPAKALTRWKTVIETQPDYAPAYFNFTRLAAGQQQFAAQMDYLEKRLQKKPDFRAPYDAVLEAGYNAGRIELARDWVNQMAKKHPKAAAPRNALTAFDRDHSAQPAPSSPVKTNPVQSTPTPSTSPPSTSSQSTLGGSDKAAPPLRLKPSSSEKKSSPPSVTLPKTSRLPERESSTTSAPPVLQSAPADTPRSVITPAPPLPSLEKEE